MSDSTFRDEIRETVSPYKFGGDRMAAACWLLSLDSSEDEYTGDACDWHYYAARFGRRIMFVTPQGFVSCVRYATEEASRLEFNALEAEYLQDTEEEDIPAGYVPEDSVTLTDGEYCQDCGQIGCGWHV